MSSLNKHCLIGYVGRDPEVRYTQAGDPIANFSIATSEKWTDKKTGEKKEKTEWHQITAYTPLAEVVSKYVTKGKQVYIEGPSSTEEWTDRAGAKRSTTKVTARQLVLLGGGARDNNDEQAEPVAAGKETGNEFDPDIPF